MSDVNEHAMTKSEIVELRANYVKTLNEVSKSVLDSGAFYAIAGPEILGEGSLFLPRRFWNKIPMLDDYRTMNKAVAAAFNIDIRQAFLDAIPSIWLLHAGYVTVDGEHENERGTQIVADKLAAALLPWLQSQTKRA